MTAAVPPSRADLANMTEPESRSNSAVRYFPRHLRFSDHKGEIRYVSESEFLATPGPKIILGEPGMGKSELIHEAARTLGIQCVTAVRFMLSKNPAKLVVSGKPLLIDGLDEALTRHEGDAVDEILVSRIRAFETESV